MNENAFVDFVGDFATNFIAILRPCTFVSPEYFSRNRSSGDFPFGLFPFSFSFVPMMSMRYNLFTLWILMYARSDSNGNKIVDCHSLERRSKENNGDEAV